MNNRYQLHCDDCDTTVNSPIGYDECPICKLKKLKENSTIEIQALRNQIQKLKLGVLK